MDEVNEVVERSLYTSDINSDRNSDRNSDINSDRKSDINNDINRDISRDINRVMDDLGDMRAAVLRVCSDDEEEASVVISISDDQEMLECEEVTNHSPVSRSHDASQPIRDKEMLECEATNCSMMFSSQAQRNEHHRYINTVL